MTMSTIGSTEPAPAGQSAPSKLSRSAPEDQDTALERKIDALATEPTGGNMTRLDFAVLCLTGLVAPAVLLIWGWQ